MGRDKQGRVEAQEILTSAGPPDIDKEGNAFTTWPHSILDEAIGGHLDAAFGKTHCRYFVAHDLCQHVLGEFFVGGLPTLPLDSSYSKVRMVRHDPSTLDILCYLVSFGTAPKGLVEMKETNWAQTIEVSADTHANPLATKAQQGRYDPGAEYDPIYFQRRLTWQPGHVQQRRHSFVPQQRGAQIEQWWHFLGVPCVRFCLHSVMVFVYAGVVSIHLASSWPRARHSGLLDSQWGVLNGEHAAELLAWIFILGRFAEEVSQLRREGIRTYSRSAWNVVDATTLGACAHMNELVSMMNLGATALCSPSLHAVIFGLTFVLRLLTWIDRGEDESMSRHTLDLFAIGGVLVYARVLSTLAMYPSVGLTLRILLLMVAEALPILAVTS